MNAKKISKHIDQLNMETMPDKHKKPVDLSEFKEPKLKRKSFNLVETIAAMILPVVMVYSILPVGGDHIVYAADQISHEIEVFQQEECEYVAVRNTLIDVFSQFVKGIAGEPVRMPKGHKCKPKIEVPVDMSVEENTQKSVDEGHSPWRLDPLYVAQVFVSLKISPGGIEGEYPIKYEELELIKNTERDAIVKVTADETPVSKVYLKRLIRQESTGIWTVVGYDPAH